MSGYVPKHARRPDLAELAREAPHLLALADLITADDSSGD